MKTTKDKKTILEERVDPEHLERFRAMYAEQLCRGLPSAAATFSYAVALTKSRKTDVRSGVVLLENLLKRDSEDNPKEDCIYALAIANARLKKYDRAMEYLQLLLSVEKDDEKALELKKLIEKRMKRDGIIGFGVVVGAAVVGVAAVVLSGGR